MPEPALEFAVLSTKAASEKKPDRLQCSISAVVEDDANDDDLRPVSEQESLQSFQRSLLVSLFRFAYRRLGLLFLRLPYWPISSCVCALAYASNDLLRSM